MAILIDCIVIVVALTLVTVATLHARRKARELSEADPQRMSDVKSRIRASPVRYLSTAATAVMILAINIGTLPAWTGGLIFLAVALVLVDRNRRKILRDEGFSLTWWGDPDYSKGTSR